MRNYNLFINKLYIINLLKFIYVVLFVILYYNNYITNDRFFSFLLILIIILMYTRIIRVFQNDIQLQLINKKNVNKWLIFSKYKNIFLYLISVIEIKIYDLIAYFNVVLTGYFKQFIIFLLYLIVMTCIIKPIKLIFYFYYKLIVRWSSMSILELLLKRIEGLIFSVLIFSNLYNMILYLIKMPILIFMLYIILIIINLVLEYNNGYLKFWKFKILINYDYYSILWLRYQVSIINILILKFVEKNKFKVNNKFNKLIHIWYVKDNFICYINKIKLENINFFNKMKLAFKNKPSIVIHNWLYRLYESNLIFSNWLDNKFYLDKILDIRIKNLIQFYYEFDELKVKLFLFLLWDIEDHYGFTDISHYKGIIDMDLASLNIDNIFNNINSINYNNIKFNNNLFYDIDLNFNFFYKLHIILNDNELYNKYINLIENDLSEGFDRTLDCYNNIDNEEVYALWINCFIIKLREEWVLLNTNQKDILYNNILQLLYEYNNKSHILFNEPWINIYINSKIKKVAKGVNLEIIDWINKVDAECNTIELKKSKFRRFLEYLFHSL